MKNLLFLLLAMFAVANCYSQQWNSENDINNYYNSEIHKKQEEINKYEQQRRYAQGLPDEDAYGNRNKEKLDLLIEAGVMIQVLKQEIANLEEEHSKQTEAFRQKKAAEEAQRKQEQIEQNMRQQEAIRQKNLQAQKEQQATAQLKEQQLEEEKKRKAEEELRAKKKAEEEAEMERKRQEEQRRYNEGYNSSLKSSARSYARKQRTLNQMDDNMAYLKSVPGSEIDGLPRHSGYVRETGGATTSKRSKTGILTNVKRGENEDDKRARLLKELEEIKQQNARRKEELDKLLQ